MASSALGAANAAGSVCGADMFSCTLVSGDAGAPREAVDAFLSGACVDGRAGLFSCTPANGDAGLLSCTPAKGDAGLLSCTPENGEAEGLDCAGAVAGMPGAAARALPMTN